MYYAKHRFSLIVLFASFSFFPLRLFITLKTIDKTCSILETGLCSLSATGGKKQYNEGKNHVHVNLIAL